jgi:hypothetical protein
MITVFLSVKTCKFCGILESLIFFSEIRYGYMGEMVGAGDGAANESTGSATLNRYW